jgi:hypothetical protein
VIAILVFLIPCYDSSVERDTTMLHAIILSQRNFNYTLPCGFNNIDTNTYCLLNPSRRAHHNLSRYTLVASVIHDDFVSLIIVQQSMPPFEDAIFPRTGNPRNDLACGFSHCVDKRGCPLVATPSHDRVPKNVISVLSSDVCGRWLCYWKARW